MELDIFNQDQIAKYEQIWIDEHVNYNYLNTRSLDDDDYINYHIWEDQNFENMALKHMPNCYYLRGNNPNLIFSGRCLGCLSQRIYGIDRCKGCRSFKGKGNNDLFIEGEKADSITQEEFMRVLTGSDVSVKKTTPNHGDKAKLKVEAKHIEEKQTQTYTTMKKTEKEFTLNLYHVIGGVVAIIMVAVAIWYFGVVSGGALISAGVTILLVLAIIGTQIKDVTVFKDKDGDHDKI